MNGYSNHAQFNVDYIGGTNTTRENDYNSNASTPGPTALHNHGIQATANALAPLRSVVQTTPPTTMQQQQQQQQQQHQQLAQPQALLYDMSSFDPLQAQALQLSASAGLTTADILAAATGAPGFAAAPTPAVADTNNSVNTTPVAAHPVTSYSQQQTQAPAHGAPVAAPVPVGQLQHIQPAPSAAAPHPYIFIQPQQFAPSAATAPAGTPTTFTGSPATPASNPLLVPVPGAAQFTSQQAQANAVAGLAAGLGAHQFLLNPALFATAAAQGIPGLTAATLQQHHAQPTAHQKQAQAHHAHVAATANALGPTLILPSINPHMSHQHSKKRPLGSGVVMNEIAPSVVSSATSMNEANKRHRGGQTKNLNDSEEAKRTEDPAEKRRYERNMREQQRSSKISSQIKELREVLSECNVPFKPNKYSILLKVVEYIKQLQSRAIMLDAEHQKLITTVRQTNETITNAANNNGMSSTTCGPTDNESLDTTQDGWQQGDRVNSRPRGRGDSDFCFVKGIDYRSVFEQCPTAFGIAALDGRILECNVEFQNLLGYTVREELLKQSLFNLVHNHQDIFRAMAQMLKTAEEPTPKNTAANAASGASANDNSLDRFWTGPVTSKQNVKVSRNNLVFG